MDMENLVMLSARLLILLGAVYAVVGVAFAVPFVLRGVNRIDPAAFGGSRGFRLIIIPGVVALWPILLRRLLVDTEPPEERNAHRIASHLRDR